MSDDKNKRPLSTREKMVIQICMLMLRIIGPWEYDHQFKPIFDGINDLMTPQS